MEQRRRDGSYHLLHRANLDGAEELKRSLRALNERLASAVDESNAKDELLEEHSRVAEEALEGWEKAEAEAAFLRQRLVKMAADGVSLEKENSSLRYEVAVLEEELQVRGEEKEKQSLAMAKRVSEMEAELQRVRGILRRRHPLKSTMTMTMTMTNQAYVSALEEEKRVLSEALEKKMRELDMAWSLCSRTASKLSRAETELGNWRREKPAGDLGLMNDFLEMEKSVSLESSLSFSAQAQPETRPEMEAAVRKLVDLVNVAKEKGNGDGELLLSLRCEPGELVDALQDLGQACNRFLEQGSDLESFILALASSMEWVNGHCSVTNTKTKAVPERTQEWEISTASEKLAECQETILSLGKQLRALAPPPKDAPLLDHVITSGGHVTLVDWILADCEKRSDGGPTANVAVAEAKALEDGGEKKPSAGPIIVAQKRPKKNLGMMLRRLLMRRKEKSARKVVSLHPISL
ncbi:uncharacterized protein LOC144708421 [Wolffia australiana]